MPNPDFNRPIPVVGVEGLVLFPVLSDTKAGLTTDDENIIDMSDCLVSKAYAPDNAAGKDFYASNKKALSIKNNKGGTLTYVIPSLLPELKERILGAKKNADGVTIQGASNVSPEYICAHKVKLTNDTWALEKFAKVVFETPGETAQTESENSDFQTAELVGTIVPLNYEVTHTDGKANGDFLFSIASTNEKYATTSTDWFTKGTAGIVPASNTQSA